MPWATLPPLSSAAPRRAPRCRLPTPLISMLDLVCVTNWNFTYDDDDYYYYFLGPQAQSRIHDN